MQARLVRDHDDKLRPGGLVARLLFSGAGLAGLTVLSRLFG